MGDAVFGRKLGERAVVLGAGIAGLLTARVLSEFYGSVVVVERDVLSDRPDIRRGVPQARHVHALLSRGSQVVGDLFPGLLDELVAAGANVCDEGDLSRVCVRVGGHEFNRSGKFGDPTGLVVYVASRPFLELHVRRRVKALENVQILDGHDVVGPIANEPHRVTGAQVVKRENGVQTVVNADLVVDALGRGATTPVFLDGLCCYGRPAEKLSRTPVTYASQLLRIPSGVVTEKSTLVGPTPQQPIGGSILAYENNTMMMTVAGFGSHRPPTDANGMITAAAQFAPPAVLRALQAATPLGAVFVNRHPGSVWRRYDTMARFPAGLLVVGDAICSFNPRFGQGMTVAAMQAAMLRDCLTDGDTELSRRFFSAAATQISAVWRLNHISTSRSPAWGNQPQDRPTLARRVNRRLGDCWANAVLAAAEKDIAVAEQLLRVQHLVDSPSQLQHPAFLLRVASNLRPHLSGIG
jgi:2-polyprenyl-6-methoxyphenol hydroxylase-like FAD-dependent oxidoreductase